MTQTLVMHIGAGKTGTSSIQETYRLNQDKLRELGIWYCGLMLEFAPVVRYPWQRAAGNGEFLALSDAQRNEQLGAILDESLGAAASAGCHTLVWSNEFFFGLSRLLLPVLTRLKEHTNVRVVAYVRRHDKWIRSAYLQWGIKHKAYPGRLLPFQEWRKTRNFGFAGAIVPWLVVDSDWLLIRNFDAKPDVVEDFNSIVGVPPNTLKQVRVNDSPSNTAMALWALYNDQAPGEVFPSEFETVLEAAGLMQPDMRAVTLEQLLPTLEDLAAFQSEMATDSRQLDALLRANGEPPLPTEPLTDRPVQTDILKMLAALTRLAAHQSRELAEIRKLLRNTKTMKGDDTEP
jgi:hypothetical protein